MQGRAVAKLAMKASCRHYLHEPRRRPQSTFIVVRHLHFLGNRGFGARNELCSHIDYSPLFSRLNGERALVVACAATASLDRRAGGRKRILAYPRGERRFFRLFAGSGLPSAGHPFLPPAVLARPGGGALPARSAGGANPRPRAFAGCSRLSASGRDGSPPGGRPDSPAGRSPHSHSLE